VRQDILCTGKDKGIFAGVKPRLGSHPKCKIDFFLTQFCQRPKQNHPPREVVTSLKSNIERKLSCSSTGLLYPQDMGATVSSSQHLCKQCSKWSLQKAFTASASSYDDALRDPENQNIVNGRRVHLRAFQKKNCPFCKYVVQLCSMDPEYAKSTDCVVGLRVSNYGKYSPNKMTHESDCKYIRRLLISAEFTVFVENNYCSRFRDYTIQICDNTALCGRIINGDIDMSIIREWLRLCETHGKCSVQSTRGDMRVIDVIEERVCYAAEPDYAALSYTWGPPNITQLKLTKETQRSLFSPDGIMEAPKTIRDAVKVCKGLGIRYLWVDALCIFQDGTNLNEINNMNKIYAGAHITIVCASGEDSWAGLPGVNPGTRKVNREVHIIDNLPLSTVEPSFRQAMEGTVWSTRGWTFQESVLSPRLLLFTDSQVFYQCKTELWYEDTVLETAHQEFLELYFIDWGNPLERLSLDECSSLYEYTRLVEQYTRRHFTYQSDIVRAFSGILEPLQNFKYRILRLSARTILRLRFGLRSLLPRRAA